MHFRILFYIKKSIFDLTSGGKTPRDWFNLQNKKSDFPRPLLRYIFDIKRSKAEVAFLLAMSCVVATTAVASWLGMHRCCHSLQRLLPMCTLTRSEKEKCC